MRLAVILISTALCYLQVAGHGWLNWDDTWLISENLLIQTPSWHNLKAVLFDLSSATRLKLGAEYLPLRDLSLMLDWQLFGNRPGMFLLHNLLIYLAALTLLYANLRRFCAATGADKKHPLLPLTATLLFALHPLHVEAVAWASARKEVLALVFMMGCWWAFENYLQRPRRVWAIIATLLLACAMLSKYTAVVLPALLAWRYICFARGKLKTPQLWAIGAPMALATCALLLNALAVGRSVQMTGYALAESWGIRLLSALDVLRRYLENLALPTRLSPVYEVEALRPLSLAALPAWTLAISLLLLTCWLWLRRRKPALSPTGRQSLFWGGWLLISLAPFMQLVSIQNKMADRYLIVASLGFCFLLAYGVLELSTRLRLTRALQTTLIAGLALTYAALTTLQVSYWKDSLSLWSRAVEIEPRSAMALYQLANSHKEHGDFASELLTLEQLINLHPLHEKGWNNYAVNLRRAGASAAELLPIYRYLLRLNPHNPKAWHNYGQLSRDVGKLDTAIKAFRQAIALQHDYCLAWRSLTTALQQAGEKAAAAKADAQAKACAADQSS